MSNVPKKSISSGGEIKYIDNNIMRNKDGKISKSFINKLEAEYKADSKKGKANRFLKNNIDNLRKNGVGVRVYKKSIDFYDLYTNKDGSKYIKDVNSKQGSYSDTRQSVLSNLRKRRKLDRLLKNRIDRGQLKVVKPYETPQMSRLGDGVRIRLTYKIKDMDAEDKIENFRLNLERVVDYGKRKYPNMSWNIHMSKNKKIWDDNLHFVAGKVSTKSGEAAIDNIIERIEQFYSRYDEDGKTMDDIQWIGLTFYITPDTIYGAGGQKTIQQANNIWFICDSYAKSNCFWRSIAFMDILKKIDSGVLPVELLDDDDRKSLHTRITNNAKSNKSYAKKSVGTHIKLTTEEDIQKWIDMRAGHKDSKKRKYTKIVIWNEVYKKVRTFTPTGIAASKCGVEYEIWNTNGHFIPMVRWYKLENIKDICKKKVADMIVRMEKEDTYNSKIESKTKWEVDNMELYIEYLKQEKNMMDLTVSIYEKGTKYFNKTNKAKLERGYIRRQLNNCNGENIRRQLEPIDNRIAAYDFEATANGTDGEEFKVFRTSMAYNEVDENNNIILNNAGVLPTKTFGGKDSVKDWLLYLSNNAGTFRDYTFYAHNGGKFDLLLILNEYILENDTDWEISPDLLIVLNGAYLNMVLVHKSSTEENPITITLKDSLKLLPAGLGKLTDEFGVEHKKIGEVVNHDDVNISNCFGGKVENVNPKTFFASEAFKVEVSQKVYCNYDCIGLLEILNSFNRTIWNRCGFSITECITGATLSKKNYMNKYYNDDTPIYNLCDKMDNDCRVGYFGGRNESLYIGRKVGKLYYFDFTSLYPDVARYRVPYGRPFYLTAEGVDELNKRRKGEYFHTNATEPIPVRSWKRILSGSIPIGMIRVKVKTLDENALPLHAIKKDGKLLFPVFENWTELTIWTSELIYGAELGIYEYEILGGVCFAPTTRPSMGSKEEEGVWLKYPDELYRCHKGEDDKGDLFSSPNGILKDFFEDAFNGKAKAKKEGLEALAFAEKIIANSGYGFWGININGWDGEGRDGLEILKEDDETLWNLIRREEVVNVNKKGKYHIVRLKRKLEVKNFNVAIAAAICSEARMKLYRLLKMVKESGGDVYYMDTDSCIIDMPLNDEMIKTFDWDEENECRAYGEPLGTLKNECVEKLEKYFKKRIAKGDFKMEYISPDGRQLYRAYNSAETKAKVKELVQMEIDADNGELCFDKGIFGGCKQYCLHKTLSYVEPNGKHGEVIANAFKGCKRDLDYSDYEHLIFGTKKEEQKKIEAEILSRNPNFVAPKGYRLYEKQSQFRSSIIDHIGNNKTGAYTPIQRVDIDKSFRINYLKGTIEGANILDGIDGSGFITPMRL